jgi:hypothetical protein
MVEQLHVVLHPVRTDRTDDFERFLRDVVGPAVRAQRPDLDGRWRALRSAGPTDGVVTYAFVLEGGSLEGDWELDLLVPAHFGQHEAERLFSAWGETFAPLGPWAEAAVSSGRETNQLVWTLEPVALT